MPIINLHKKISCTGLRAQVDHVLMEALTQIFKTRCRVSEGFFQLKGDILHTVFFLYGCIKYGNTKACCVIEQNKGGKNRWGEDSFLNIAVTGKASIRIFSNI